MNNKALTHHFQVSLCILLVLCTLTSYSQSVIYTEHQSQTNHEIKSPFAGIKWGDIEFLDVDGDEDFDVVLTGASSVTLVFLYINNGSGNYTEKSNTPFTATNYGSVSSADVDNDGDTDLLITGNTDASGIITSLFLNDGQGNFTEKTNPSIINVSYSSSVFADFDNDNDQDLLIAGYYNSQKTTKLYTNDGEGNFTEDTDNSFSGIIRGDIQVCDVDNDSDIDIFLTGNGEGANISELYINDGTGGFALDPANNLVGIYRGSAAFSDIDADSDYDLLISGSTLDGSLVCELYKNNGSGLFEKVEENGITKATWSSLIFFDSDNDNDQDLVVSGRTEYGTRTFLYLNDGAGNFFKDESNPLTGVENSSVDAADIDGDGDIDLLYAGNLEGQYPEEVVACLYINDNGSFTKALPPSFEDFRNSSMDYADVDLDGDLDVLISGRNSLNQVKANLYLNDGSGNYYQQNGSPFTGIENGSIRFADFNNDDYPDVAIAGGGEASGINVYLNDRSGKFQLKEITGLPQPASGCIEVADLNNDGNVDICIAGLFPDGTSTYYKNNGYAYFSEYGEVILGQFYPRDFHTDVKNASMDVGDVNNDGFVDVFITGLYAEGTGTRARVTLNNGQGLFNYSTTSVSSPLESIGYGDAMLAYIDSDEYLDMFMTGYHASITGGRETACMIKNDGDGHFYEYLSESWNSQYPATIYGSVDFADADNDGDQDFLLTGWAEGDSIAEVFLNDGQGEFEKLDNSGLTGVYYSDARFLDANNDGIQDIILSGNASSILGNFGYRPLTRLYLGGICYSTEYAIDTFCCGSFTAPDGITYNSSGSYTAIIPNSQGCDSVITINLTVGNASESTIDTTVCADYTAPDGSSYNSAGTYTVIIPNTQDCDSTIQITLTISPLNNNITLAGDSLEVIETDAVYQWLECTGDSYTPVAGENGRIFAPEKSGSYAAEIRKLTCIDTTECINLTISNLNQANEENLKIYPNPASDRIDISIPNGNINAVSILNMQGKILYSNKAVGKHLEVSLPNEVGIFLVRVVTDESTYYRKIIKE